MNTESILGYEVTSAPARECIDLIMSWVRSPKPVRVVACANPHGLVTARGDAPFAEAMHAADLLIPDGTGIVMASRILGGHIRARITGSDLFALLNSALNDDGNRSCFFLGSTEQTLSAIREKMSHDYPRVRIAGMYSPPFKNEFTPEDNDRMIDAVNGACPDLLWVGMTQPKQEKWIQQNRRRLAVPVAAPVGAVFDFYTGRIRRSSPLFQRLGLEWLPRLMQEPRRLWRRNLNSPVFLYHVLRQRDHRRQTTDYRPR